MKHSSFLTLNGIMFIPFGLGMLMAPSLIFPMIGVNLDEDGLLMASTVGSMLFSFGLICLLARNIALDAPGLKPLLVGNLCFHMIDSVLTFKGAFSGVMSERGFIFSSMHFLLALGFLFFLMRSQKMLKVKSG